MAKTTPPNSIDRQILARLADLKSARQAHREECLGLSINPDDPARQHAVSELENEIRLHELNLERLQAAKLAQAESNTAEAEANRLQAAGDAAKTLAATNKRIAKELEKLVTTFEMVIGPVLAETDSLMRERAQLLHVVARQTLGDAAERSASNFLNNVAGAESNALLTAVIRSGLGYAGPQIAPHVSISPPLIKTTAEQALEAVRRSAERVDTFAAELVARASTPATSIEE